ncbi:uncharacterized protein YpbB [Melghiribacillus thermohalophilus]|uniref:Uncharacterized protein YpbB n=1 Tax=Melghiribacillus thermohalophilus TaxID=1324956 RepID=A0A4R3NAC9_9BACI|nr:helix-turn-helix domain-containing protein [Melghiribacillus thermohalophilus]TCT25610.1 uncharacterized protein YpbB [Melghiribacillus thermohalophilus]
MFQTIMLDTAAKLEGERSPSAMYYLLSGKRSSQTIQDSVLFQLDSYFGILPGLSQPVFEQMFYQLVRDQQIIVNQNSMFVTDSGRVQLAEGISQYKQLSMLQGLNYHETAKTFWLRLLLFIQTVSNILKGEQRFLPIVEEANIIRWVKSFYVKHRNHIDAIFHEMYEETKQLLSGLDHHHAEIMVSRMNGYRHVGKSKEQLAYELGKSIYDIEIYILSGIHYFLKAIEKEQERYKRLQQFIPEQHAEGLLTRSARKTWELLNNGMKATDIAKRRRLRIGTVHDHIVEMAFVLREFDISPYVSKGDMNAISDVLQTDSTKRLKQIKQQLPDHISYFQIRLVMAKYYKQANQIEEMADG